MLKFIALCFLVLSNFSLTLSAEPDTLNTFSSQLLRALSTQSQQKQQLKTICDLFCITQLSIANTNHTTIPKKLRSILQHNKEKDIILEQIKLKEFLKNNNIDEASLTQESILYAISLHSFKYLMQLNTDYQISLYDVEQLQGHELPKDNPILVGHLHSQAQKIKSAIYASYRKKLGNNLLPLEHHGL